MKSLACVLLASLSLLASVEVSSANDHFHTSLPSGSREIQAARGHSQRLAADRKRSLLQTGPTSPSYSGARTPAGLLIYTPVGRNTRTGNGALDPDDFGQFFTAAYNDNTIPGIRLTAGNYSVKSIYDYTYKSWQFYMGCYDNRFRTQQFELDMEGSSLFMGNSSQGAFGWDYCANFYWHGGSMTYAAGQQPFTQGTVTAISATSWTILIDRGYPTYKFLQGSGGHLCSLYAANGNLVQNASEVYAGAFTVRPTQPGQPAGQSWTFQMSYTIPDARVGMRMAIRGDTVASHMNFMNRVRNFRAANVAIYQSNIFAVADNNGYNSSYNNITVIPDPRGIPGTTNPPLFSTNADGIHVTLPGYGPQITNCNMRNTGDDAIAAHGIYLMVASINNATNSITVATQNCFDPSCLPMQPGDPLLLYSPLVAQLGVANVTGVANGNKPANVSGQSQNAPTFNYDTAAYFEITFAAGLPANWTRLGGFDGYVTDPTENGNRATISGNVVGNNRARGIFYKGINSVINNNRVTGSALMAILIVPDTYFLEADFVNNVNITNNYMNVTGGGIIVTAFNGTRQPGYFPNHKNVRITGNTIVGAMHPLIVGGATGVTVTGNTITDGSCYQWFFNDLMFNQTSSNADNSGTPPGALSYTSWTSNSTYRGNTFTLSTAANRPWGALCRRYANTTQPYQRGLGVTNVTFA